MEVFLSLLLLDIVVHFSFALFVATNKASNKVSFEHFRYSVSIYMYKFFSDKKDHFMHIYVYLLAKYLSKLCLLFTCNLT